MQRGDAWRDALSMIQAEKQRLSTPHNSLSSSMSTSTVVTDVRRILPYRATTQSASPASNNNDSMYNNVPADPAPTPRSYHNVAGFCQNIDIIDFSRSQIDNVASSNRNLAGAAREGG